MSLCLCTFQMRLKSFPEYSCAECIFVNFFGVVHFKKPVVLFKECKKTFFVRKNNIFILKKFIMINWMKKRLYFDWFIHPASEKKRKVIYELIIWKRDKYLLFFVASIQEPFKTVFSVLVIKLFSSEDEMVWFKFIISSSYNSSAISYALIAFYFQLPAHLDPLILILQTLSSIFSVNFITFIFYSLKKF